MGIMRTVDGTGGAQFEVADQIVKRELVRSGELELSCVVYDAESKKRVEEDDVLVPGKTYGTTVAAEYGE